MNNKFESLRKEVGNCKVSCFGFELSDIETNDIYYEPVKVDFKNGTFSAFGQSIDMDETMSLDAHLEALYEAIVEGGKYI